MGNQTCFVHKASMKSMTFALSADVMPAIAPAASTLVAVADLFNDVATLVCVLGFRLR